ncbi:hypothetical protein Nmel_014721, partial [Mimus melanotis]
MRLLLHVEPVHLHDAVPGAQPRSLGGRAGLHFADELAALALLAVQVVVPLGCPGTQLGAALGMDVDHREILHFSTAADGERAGRNIKIH